MSPPHTIRVVEKLLGSGADKDAGTDGKKHVHDALGIRRPCEDDRHDEEYEHERTLAVQCRSRSEGEEQVMGGIEQRQDELESLDVRGIRKHAQN